MFNIQTIYNYLLTKSISLFNLINKNNTNTTNYDFCNSSIDNFYDFDDIV